MSGQPKIPLTKAQRDLMAEFYDLPLRAVLLSKKERDEIWKSFRENRSLPHKHLDLKFKCPALVDELAKALNSASMVQSAVFSECVYAQTLANHFGLSKFTNYLTNPQWLTSGLEALLLSYNLKPRYIYKNPDSSRMLIQAGGHKGVDGALISVLDNNVFTIEFKEPAAKTSELDLPKYGEDGNLILTDEWAGKYPQFLSMLNEQIEAGLNFWDKAGSNINDFSPDSIQQAVTDNYIGKKFADVICTEDSKATLTMIPSNHVHLWANVRGEIRPSGRNPYRVWTPKALDSAILKLGGSITSGRVRLALSKFKTAKPRGGTGISRYKIGPLFFVRSKDIQIASNIAEFELSKVWQLNPTISAHMFFRGLKANKVKKFYEQQLKEGSRDG